MWLFAVILLWYKYSWWNEHDRSVQKELHVLDAYLDHYYIIERLWNYPSANRPEPVFWECFYEQLVNRGVSWTVYHRFPVQTLWSAEESHFSAGWGLTDNWLQNRGSLCSCGCRACNTDWTHTKPLWPHDKEPAALACWSKICRSVLWAARGMI